MKVTSVLPLVAVATAFVIPDESTINQLVIESQKDSSLFDKLPTKADVSSYLENTVTEVVKFSENAFDQAVDLATHVGSEGKHAYQCFKSMTAFDANAWLESSVADVEYPDVDPVDVTDLAHHPRHKKPHHKPNQTIWELISTSKYTTQLAKYISEYDDLVDALNGTAANYTLFAPTDEAFKRIPKDHKKPTKEQIKKVLSYHVSSHFYPAGRVLVTHTIPSIVSEKELGGEPQRLRVGFSLKKGLNINFYSSIVAVDIFATNGVIHGVDHIILPPPEIEKIIELFPSEFSTLLLAVEKTNIVEDLPEGPFKGATFFAPSNWAFKKLGPRVNAFLFSKHGLKYLKAILKYHVVVDQTLYSDAFYNFKKSEASTEGIPKGRYHVELATLLSDKDLSIDIARWGGLIQMKINGYTDVAVQDGIAEDGVIHLVNTVLIPPKSPGDHYMGEELSVTDLKERFDALIEQNGWEL